MTSKKERRKQRKNTDKLIDEAWEALASGHETLAERLGRRAVENGFMNPRIWYDHGRLLDRLGRRGEAERAYRNAITIAPAYVDALASLAGLLATDGRGDEARGIQRRVVELAPDDAGAAARLASLGAEAPDEAATEPGEAEGPQPAARSAHIDWDGVEEELLRTGRALLPALLDTSECASLRALWDAPDRFEHEVALDDVRGEVRYRFFARPLPDRVRELREEVYARAAPIANRWNELLGEPLRYPGSHPAFVGRCRRAGQTRTTPILLRYAEGGFNGFHRDVHGTLAFPLQLAVTLGPGPGSGGDLLLLDERPGRRRVRAISTEPGDGVIFCARDRLVRISGLYGRQPVLHAVDIVTARERFALGIPFHEYAG